MIRSRLAPILASAFLLASLVSGGAPAHAQQPPAPTPPSAPSAPPGFPPFQLPPFQWPPGMQLPGSTQPTAPSSSAPASAASSGLLSPLLGALSWQSEVRAVLNELIANLSPDKQARVQGIPLVIDPNPNTINAFAGCDEHGAPFIAGTQGLLVAIDAIAQTVANDDLFGTRTYDQYINAVVPHLVQSGSASPALPLGIIPLTTVIDPRRLSHAHEVFDDIVAFTFGHELSHHYLGHTGCAVGQGGSVGPSPAALGQLVTRVIPGLNQPNEVAADTAGCIDVLDTGRARRPAYPWTERGGLLMLDFFSRMDAAAGVSPLNPVGFLQTHPHPAFRIPIVRGVAQAWHQTHPG